MPFDPKEILNLEAALEKNLISFELFGEEHLEGVMAYQACFYPHTGTKMSDQKYAIALDEIAEARVFYANQIEILKKAGKALDDLTKHIAKAKRKGKGAQKMSDQDFLNAIDILTEQEVKKQASSSI
jgi:hypothetical protein